MIKRSFVGLARPRFGYETLESTPAEPEKIALPKKIKLFFKGSYDRKDAALLKEGDSIKTGQQLLLYEDSDAPVISPVTGTIASLSPYVGDFAQAYTAVCIDVAADETDEEFKNHDLTLDNLKKFLACAPGAPAWEVFSNPDKPISTMVVCGVDKDLQVTTRQYVLRKESELIDKGISILKKVTGVENVVVVMPEMLVKAVSNIGGASGAELKGISSEYPAGLPHMIAKDVLGKVIPAGKSAEDMGVCFLSAEAVASVADAAENGNLPVTKTLTLIKKDLSKVLVQARIGTPVRDIFTTCDVTVNEKDRVIIGGPMTGNAVYSEDYPVLPDTDAIMVQDAEDIPLVSDYPCTNCGECIKICPAKVPVNDLVRLCEAREYETAADQFDLLSCIECGLCSVVCVAKMPIFQYIRLAKYELSQMVEDTAETAETEEEAA